MSLDVSPTERRWSSTSWATSTPSHRGGCFDPHRRRHVLREPAALFPRWADYRALSDRSGVENLWLVRRRRFEPRAVTKDKETKSRPQLMASPSWTTDGEYLLVSKSRPPERTYGLFLYHRDGGAGARVGPPPPKDEPPVPGQPPIQPPNKLGAVASPDGRYIYYAERRGAFNYNAQFPIWQIVRFDRGPARPRPSPTPRERSRPLLSPDGKSLVYASRFRTGTGLRVRDLETGAERWLHYP
jgi:Tol biopolymer transport system component